MKIKITNNDLIKSFLPALKEISLLRTPTKVAYNVQKTIKNCDELSKLHESARISILESRCLMDSNNNPRIEFYKESGLNEYVFQTPQIRAEALKSTAELAQQEVEVEIFPITIDDIDMALLQVPILDKDGNIMRTEYSKASISGEILLHLRDFISEPEELQVAK